MTLFECLVREVKWAMVLVLMMECCSVMVEMMEVTPFAAAGTPFELPLLHGDLQWFAFRDAAMVLATMFAATMAVAWRWMARGRRVKGRAAGL